MSLGIIMSFWKTKQNQGPISSESARSQIRSDGSDKFAPTLLITAAAAAEEEEYEHTSESKLSETHQFDFPSLPKHLTLVTQPDQYSRTETPLK